MVNNPPAIQEIWVQSLGWEDPLEKGMTNQSILKEINPEYSLDGLMLKLKLQYFGHQELTQWKRP